MTLTSLEYQLVATFIAGTFSVMLAAAIYFLVSRESVRGSQRQTVMIAAVYTGIAAFHYSRILGSWTDSFKYEAGNYISTGAPVFAGYRYADWLITVPLLVTQLVMVLALDARMTKRLTTQLALAATLMVALGFPGEIATSTPIKLVFWALGCVPFGYLVYVLYVGMSESLRRQSKSVVRTISNARLLLLVSWLTYPIVYLLPMLGMGPLGTLLTRQIGYSVADVIAKPLFALFLLRVAQLKSAEEASHEVAAPVSVSAPQVPAAPVRSSVPVGPTLGTAAAAAPAASKTRIPVPPMAMDETSAQAARNALGAAALADVEAALQAPSRSRVPMPPTSSY
jgi:bacteriorhodopsin